MMMSTTIAKSTEELAGMVAYLGRLAHGQGFVCGLTTAQWTALRYFAHANRYSRTLSAFADYHATTRGTASQTVKSLVTKGFLSRTRSSSDGRSVRFDLTDKGRVVYDHDPFQELVHAVAILPPGLQFKLQTALGRVIGHMAHERQRPPFGTCPTCLHLAECVHHEDYLADYFCRLANEPIEESSLNKICMNYEPELEHP